MIVKKEIVLSRGREDIVLAPLKKSHYRVGRSPANDLPVLGKTVSRHQCEIVEDNGVFSLKDLSGKGTVVDGKKVKNAKLNEKSIIKIGQYQLRIRDIPEKSVTTITTVRSGTGIIKTKDSEGQVLALSGSIGDKPVKAVIEGRTFNIGSDETNDLVIKEFGVSGFHCRIYQDKGEWWITDLDSTNGTFVDKEKTKETTIRPGKVIGLGDVKLDVMDGQAEAEYPGAFGMIGDDPGMCKVFEQIETTAKSDGTALIVGETGSGKEVAALAIHQASKRSGKKFLVFDCATAEHNLIQSALFGHVKGAFTDAKEDRIGVFEEADGGTLFLDEIGDLPLNLQQKMLRALENKEIVRVGENNPRKVDTRIVAATNRSLPDMVSKGTFRQDLYYRLKVFVIEIPPLRDRPGDIPLLASYFLDTLCPDPKKKLTKRALKKLCDHDYPGNVRELMNLIVVALARSKKDTIMPDDIDITPITTADRVAEAEVSLKGKKLEEAIRKFVLSAIKNNKGILTKAAKELGKSPPALYRLMEKLGIERETKFK